MTRKQKRFAVIVTLVSVIIAASFFILMTFYESISYFYSPSEIIAKNISPAQRIRTGGLVEAGSIENTGVDQHKFVIADSEASMIIKYKGILPDLFREGQGIIAEGVMDADGTFLADTLLAKHDENYMPREVADKLKEQQLWKGEEKKTNETGTEDQSSGQSGGY